MRKDSQNFYSSLKKMNDIIEKKVLNVQDQIANRTQLIFEVRDVARTTFHALPAIAS